ncbi:MAG: histidine phosphatase family protein [Mariprofundaceae bacterium]
MKRTITLIRHAKSDWGAAGLSDFDRPLNHRGNRDAPLMGSALKEKNSAIDLILASPAKRAFATVHAICNVIEYNPDTIDFRPDLYLAPASDMMGMIQSIDDQYQNIAIVSHNPGLTTLANMLGDRQIDNMPTCSIVILETDISSWQKLKRACATTTDFLYPKQIQ